jgi:hypothetical protein
LEDFAREPRDRVRSLPARDPPCTVNPPETLPCSPLFERVRAVYDCCPPGVPPCTILFEGLPAVYDSWSAGPLPCTKTSDFCTRQGFLGRRIVHGLLGHERNCTRLGAWRYQNRARPARCSRNRTRPVVFGCQNRARTQTSMGGTGPCVSGGVRSPRRDAMLTLHIYMRTAQAFARYTHEEAQEQTTSLSRDSDKHAPRRRRAASQPARSRPIRRLQGVASTRINGQ